MDHADAVAAFFVAEVTEVQEQSAVDALGEHLDEVCDRLDGWRTRCVEAVAFPAGILNRAAG